MLMTYISIYYLLPFIFHLFLFSYYSFGCALSNLYQCPKLLPCRKGWGVRTTFTPHPDTFTMVSFCGVKGGLLDYASTRRGLQSLWTCGLIPNPLSCNSCNLEKKKKMRHTSSFSRNSRQQMKDLRYVRFYSNTGDEEIC